jgi:peroxiredoxin Q/BCP
MSARRGIIPVVSRSAAYVVFLVTLVITPSVAHAMKKELQIGDPAPDFSLVDQNGKMQHLSAYRKHWVVLYFYPKDDTPGCTREACSFRDDYLKLAKLNAEILGISIDNAESHAAFASKYHLPFPLLADSDGKIANAYGSYFSFGPLKFARRHTFIIDPSGKIARIYRKVKPGEHSDQVMQDLVDLQKNPEHNKVLAH